MYKLSSALFGHSMDVRSLAVTPDGCIISASRDKTTKVWKPNEFNACYTESVTLKGHNNFVSAVTFIKSSSRYPLGLVITGSNDKKICVFDPLFPDPLFTLTEHLNTVCCVSPGLKENTFLSASWDLSAKLWCLETQRSKFTLTGHESAVWGVVQVANGIIVTASADKTIRLHSAEGKLLQSLTGHTDCVRGLALLNDTQFISCSNDASIKIWDSNSGKCVETFYGHPNFIYSVAAQGDLILSGGEDQCVCVYQNKNQTSFLIPAVSVWSVAILPNTDIVTGSSDGIIRVFSSNPERQAEPSVLAEYAEEVKKLKSANEQEIGGVKISDLPGREVLYEPGKSDGQVKMVREGASVVAYSWSEGTKEWTKLGDVMGSSGGTQATSGKVLYEGKEYDFVFSVDIEEGKPPKKLPYNLSEDPWHAAQAFIHKHFLPQVYLEQVANFIINNSKSKQPPVISQTAAAPTSKFCDPFTGGTRYVPGSGTSFSSSSTPVASAGDPFTSANSYKPNGVSSGSVAKPSFFPQKDFVRFDQANLKAILDKLKQFTKSLMDKTDTPTPVVLPSEAQLETLVKLGEPQPKLSEDSLNLLKQMLEWPKDVVFPVLDVTRLAIRDAQINETLCSGSSGRQMISLLRSNLNKEALINNQMLTLRIFSNMFSHSHGETLVLSHNDYVFSILDEFSENKLSKQMQIALISLLLNCVVSYQRQSDETNLSHALEILTKMFPNLTESEALLRALITLGTLLHGNAATSLRKNVHAGVKDLILKLSEISQNHVVSEMEMSGSSNRVNQCALQLVDVILT